MALPGVLNHNTAGRVYSAFRIASIFLLSMVYAAMAMAAWGRPVNVSTASMIGMGVLVMVVGNFLGKIRPNWVVYLDDPHPVPPAWPFPGAKSRG